MSSHSFNRYSTVAALDIGSSKVCCIIANINKEDRTGEPIKIVGYDCSASKGIKNGIVTDINEASLSVCNAVEAAEQMADERISKVIINISGDRAKSSIKHAVININKNRPINSEDASKVVLTCLSKVNIADYELIHELTGNYRIDDGEETREPRGLYADKLSVDVLLGVFPSSMYKNLENVVENARLEVEDRAFSAYASGLACLVEDERQIGATIVDIGGEVTNIATFRNGYPVQFSAIGVGGKYITNDIAWGLTTSAEHAESLKNLHGCAFLTSQDRTKKINVYPVGEEDDVSVRAVPKSELINIISARVEEIFKLINKKLDEHGLKNVTNHRVVLTGGCSQLTGIRNVASVLLDKQVRLGVPRNIANMPSALCSPEYSTAVGLLIYALNNEGKKTKTVKRSASSEGGFFSRAFGWMKQSF